MPSALHRKLSVLSCFEPQKFYNNTYGAYPVVQGGMMYGQGQTGTLPNGGKNTTNAAMQNTEDTQGQDKPESVTEPPDNDLIDFDAF